VIPELWEKLRQALFQRRYHYQQTFNQPNGADVLKDLEKFCHANVSTFHQDARMHAVLEGRREVWLRIQDHLRLSPDELWDRYDGRQPTEDDSVS